eukprot:634774-Prymnesium_polylepis.1
MAAGGGGGGAGTGGVTSPRCGLRTCAAARAPAHVTPVHAGLPPAPPGPCCSRLSLSGRSVVTAPWHEKLACRCVCAVIRRARGRVCVVAVSVARGVAWSSWWSCTGSA